MHTAELKQLQATYLYQYQMKDGIEDWLGRHDEGIQRGLGTLQAASGITGVDRGRCIGWG